MVHPEPFILRQYEGPNVENREVTVLEKQFGNRDELNIFIKSLRIIREMSSYLRLLRQ